MGEGFDTETGIKYVSFGSGKKTMAVVPGLSVGFVTDAKESLVNVFEAFKDEYTVFVFDVRKDVPENFTMEAMGEDLAEVIMRLGLNDVYMYGCSMGGIEAMYVAGKYPQLVKKLAVASSACRSNKTIQKTLKKWLKMAKTGKYRALTDNFGKKIYSKPVYEAGL